MGEVRTKIRDILGAFLFSGEDADKKVKVLSGGEKSRVAMIRLMLEPVNFLVLDEPTNHLDMTSKEILKNALAQFSGTILVVSHDREFLDGLVNCVYEFRDKKIIQHLGGIYDFLQRRRMESLKELNSKAIDAVSGRNNSKTVKKGHEGLSYQQRKAITKNISRFEKQVASCEEFISELEGKIAKMDKVLSSSEVVHDSGVFEEYDQLKAKLESTMEEWEKQHEELEYWKSQKSW